MPYDLTLCGGGDCPIKENCIRNTAKVYGRQNFFGSIPYNFNRKFCEYFLDDRPSEDNIRLLAYQIWEQNGKLSGNDLEYWLLASKQLLDKNRNL